MPISSKLFEAGEEIVVDGKSDIRLESGDHQLRTRQGITLEVREGCVFVGVQGGFDWIGIDHGERPGAKPFHGSVQLNPDGVGRFRVQEGQHVVFDIRAAA